VSNHVSEYTDADLKNGEVLYCGGWDVYIKWWKCREDCWYCSSSRALSATMKTATLAGLAASLVAVVDAHGMRLRIWPAAMPGILD